MKKLTQLKGQCALMFLLTSSLLYADGYQGTTGARQAGMGRTSISITDFWGCQNNQAGIALIEEVQIGLSYENRFSLSQLSTKNIGIIVPTGFGVLGLTARHFGYDLYNEIKLGLVYAKSFGPFFRIGIQLDYLRTALGEDYGSKSMVTFEVGIQSDISNSITLAAWVFNPIQVKLTDFNNERIPAILKLGLKWQVGKTLIICMETEKSTLVSPIVLRAGIEYGINKKFFLRGGFATAGEIFSMGFGFSASIIGIDLSASMHQYLGFSQEASLIFKF